MILNFNIIVELMLGVITLLLGSYGGYIAYQILKKRKANSEEHLEKTEKQYFLLSMISMILLSSRIINVFFFYYVLVSLIPIIPGAMCPYGVLTTSVSGVGLVNLSVKLFLPFVYAGWLILDSINKKSKKLNLRYELSTGFLYLLTPLLLFDAILDWVYFGFMEPITTNCCRNVYNEAFEYQPLTILGSETAIFAFIFTLVLILSIIVLQYQLPKNENFILYSLIVAVLSIPLIIITIQDFISPLWIFASKAFYQEDLGMAHHCPFCMLKRWWTMVPYIVLIWLGLATTGWQMLISFIGQKDTEMQKLSNKTILTLRKICIISFILAIVILFTHMFIFGVLGIP